ncbi:hypothetical protein [Photobacterium leiognathi]|uniref:hypothetical protein n=1 Tax=Photobacterium leiognathi TaxID=553611 RepID=UPI002981FAE3|nr:hypothetical protein [Photobacterium leiognathi]
MSITLDLNQSRTLYLDERGHRTPKQGLYPDFFFIGGISIADKDKPQLSKFVKDFKLSNYGDGNWELKGAGNPSILKGISKDQQPIEAKKKWSAWSQAISSLDVQYELYGTFVKLSDYHRSHPNSNEKDVIKAAFLSVVDKFVKYGCSNSHYDGNSEIYPSSIIFDNIDGIQKEAINEAFEQSKISKPILSNMFKIGGNIDYVKNNDFNLVDELIMQFVDMQIYALTRFLNPIQSKKEIDRLNILVDFEEYAYLLPKLQSGEETRTNEQLLKIVQFFNSITPLFQHLRYKLKVFGIDNDEIVTSLTIVGDKEYLGFAIEANAEMADFCNLMKYPTKELFTYLNNSL